MKYQKFLPDAEATFRVGALFGEQLKSEIAVSKNISSEKNNTMGEGVPIAVFLNGVLGAGKTSFCGAVLSAFGHSGAVKSPTYTLVEPYVFDHLTVYHFDLYRLGDPEELDYMGIRDYFDAHSVALIEWPERGRGFLPHADLVVSLNPSAMGRNLECVAGSKKGEAILSRML